MYFRSDKVLPKEQQFAAKERSRWRILSTVPTIELVMLVSGESRKGRIGLTSHTEPFGRKCACQHEKEKDGKQACS